MKTLVMQLSQDVAREKTGIEMISGLSSVSDQFTVHFGRPDWKAQFNELELRHESAGHMQRTIKEFKLLRKAKEDEEARLARSKKAMNRITVYDGPPNPPEF